MAQPRSGARESQLSLQWTKGCGREGLGYDSEATAVGFLQAPPAPPFLDLLLPVGWRQVYLLPGQATGKAPQQTWELSRVLGQLLF